MNASTIGFILENMEDDHTKYHMAECPKCRRANKVALKQLQRWAPREKTEDGAAGKQSTKEKAAARRKSRSKRTAKAKKES